MTGFTSQDPRNQTIASRKHIGFAQNASEWKVADAIFGKGTLQILGHPVMEDWESPYMENLAAIATSNGGTVLEVGFGMGISANYIQNNQINEHIIIEANEAVFGHLLKFAKSAGRRVRAINGMWQDVIGSIESNSIDGILFDTYPLSVEEIHCNSFPFFEHAYRILKPGGVLTYYSDEIDHFSLRHVQALNRAGFNRIAYELTEVTPPSQCLYWTSSTILAPIVIKE